MRGTKNVSFPTYVAKTKSDIVPHDLCQTHVWFRKTWADLTMETLRWRPGPPTYLPTQLIW
eukprot:696344-Prymnesium_polylepis.1